MVGTGIVVFGKYIRQESYTVVVVDERVDRIQVFGLIDGLGLEAGMAAEQHGRPVQFQTFPGKHKRKMLIGQEVDAAVLAQGPRQQFQRFLVLLAEGKEDFFPSKGREEDLLVSDRRRKDAKIQLTLEDAAFQIVGFTVHNLDPVVRQLFLQAFQEGGQEPFSVELRDADAQLPHGLLLPVPHGFFELPDLFQDGASLADVETARRGQLDPRPAAVKERDIQIFLEPLDVLAQGGLADEEDSGGLGKAAGPGDGRHIFEITGIHDTPPFKGTEAACSKPLCSTASVFSFGNGLTPSPWNCFLITLYYKFIII